MQRKACAYVRAHRELKAYLSASVESARQSTLVEIEQDEQLTILEFILQSL